MKIFFSYPHDSNAKLVKRIKEDLEARGHQVLFDEEEIKAGDHWRNSITRMILDSQQVVAFLSKHAVRDPGVCLNEIAIALADKGEAMVTVLVEPENEVNTPVSITHIQWLGMENWAMHQEDDGWYRTRFDKLVEAIEHRGNAGRHEELETLRLALDPMSFYAEIAPHIPQFTGRKWIINRYRQWLAEDSNSRVMRIEGGPGLGKTAVSSYLAHSTKSSVLAVHLCQYNKGESRNPLRFVRTLAYQLATRLPDYRSRLLKSVAIQRPESMHGKDPASLWSDLISSPLAGSGNKGLIDRQRLAIIVDGLDEATVDGKNAIVELLASEINQLPKWIGVVLTGRPDPELTQRLARFQPLVLRDDDPENLADLKDYCDQWLAAEVKAGTLSQAQATAASQTLLKRSEGAFLYLSQARIAVAEGMLDLTRPDIFPSGLTELYQRFFERRFTDAWDDNGSFRRKVRPFLELVLASPEPLPLALAASILEWKEYEAADILRSLGSLIKRAKGGLVRDEEETVAPFHNSVREWLGDADAAGDFFVSPSKAQNVLTTAVWQRYVASNEQDPYAWAVLPNLLPALSEQRQDELFGELTLENSRLLYRLADGLAPKLRFCEAAATWGVQKRFMDRLVASEPENAEFANNLRHSYNHLTNALLNLGDFAKAEPLYREALDLSRTALPAGYPDIATNLNNLALLLRSTDRYVEAESLFREALDLNRAALPAWHPNIAASLNNLADLLKLTGRHAEAEPLYREALGIWRSLPAGFCQTSVAAALNGLAGLLDWTGHHAEAELLFREALGIWRDALPAGHPDIATGLHDLAGLLKLTNRHTEAEQLFREALDIWRASLPARHPNIATGLFNLANLLILNGRHDEAVPLYRESIMLCELADTDSATSSRALEARRYLAVCLRESSQFDESFEAFMKLLETEYLHLGREHELTLKTEFGFAKLLRMKGDRNEARKVLDDALPRARKILGDGHSITKDLFELENTLGESGTY